LHTERLGRVGRRTCYYELPIERSIVVCSRWLQPPLLVISKEFARYQARCRVPRVVRLCGCKTPAARGHENDIGEANDPQRALRVATRTPGKPGDYELPFERTIVVCDRWLQPPFYSLAQTPQRCSKIIPKNTLRLTTSVTTVAKTTGTNPPQISRSGRGW